MSRKTITIERPFIGGEITDMPTVNLDPSQASYLADAMVENGVITTRPEHYGIDITAHMNANERPTGVWVGMFDFASGDPFGPTPSSLPVYIVTTSDGRLLDFGTNPTSTPTAIDCSSFRIDADAYLFPVEFYQGELILGWSDGVSSFLRYAGRSASITSSGGTVAIGLGSTTLTGTSTTFTTQAPAGSYIQIDGLANSFVFRVVEVLSNTKLILSERMPVALSGKSWTSSRIGKIGIQNYVDAYGTASNSTTTLTGDGTRFTRASAGDQVGEPTREDEYIFVSSVSSGTSLTMSADPATDWTAPTSYVITRRLYGRTLAFHRNRIWCSGALYTNRRLYYTPANYSLGTLHNGIDSADVNIMSAVQAEFDVIGGDDAATPVVAIVSTGSGPLLVLTGDEVWEVHGDPPNLTIRRVATDIGCLDARSVITYRGDVYWAAEQGLMRWRGGAIQPVSEGRNEKRWREAIANIGITNGVIGWREDERIQMCATNSPRAIVYDADRDIWLGRWNWGSHTGGPFGAVRAACVPSTYGAVAAPTIVHWTGTSTYIIGAGGSIRGPAEFRAILGSNVFKGHEVKRVLGGRVRYRLGWQSGGFNQSVGVYYGNSPDPCAVLTDTDQEFDDEGYGSVWLDVNSAVEQEGGDGGGEDNRNYLGVTEREHRLSFEQINPTHPRDFEIDTIWLEIRERRPRA